jgi:hypothetical protein
VEHDILIGGLMVLASVVALFAIVVGVARALRDEPKAAMPRTPVTPSETAPVLQPASGW